MTHSPSRTAAVQGILLSTVVIVAAPLAAVAQTSSATLSLGASSTLAGKHDVA